MMEPLYCVTGRNRLTGEREIISKPIKKEKADQIKMDYCNMLGEKKPYTYAKVELYNPQLDLFKDHAVQSTLRNIRR
jgi:hypothetical protein